MNIGTRSVLFGVHQFLLHPLLVAVAWWRLYGFPWDARLWAAFVVHDLGYVGKPNMDGPEGERHVDLGAAVMGRLFGEEWGDFCRYHSRHRARRDGARFSRLAVADKYVIACEPWWFYLPRAALSGELREYVMRARRRCAASENVSPEERMEILSGSSVRWYCGVQRYMGRWVSSHRAGEADTWTPLINGAGPA